MSHLYDSLLERMEGREYSNYFSAFCPWDRHQTPALLVFEDGMVKCLSCNKIWNHKQLDRKLGSHFIPRRNDTVSRVLPQWKRWEEKYGSLDGIVDAAHRSLKKFPQFQTYLKRRKIYEFADEGCLGFLDSWITFPVFSPKHEILDVVVRSVSRDNDTRYVVHPARTDRLRPLYVPSWEKINESETVYIVYGIIDAISLNLSGLPAITGTSGKSLSSESVLQVGRKRFVILPDEGEEGDAHKLANQLGWRCRVKKLEYEDGCKDPDDVRKKFGNEKLLEMIGA